MPFPLKTKGPLVGAKIIFKENDLTYGQDMSFWRGVPTGIEFTVEEEWDNLYVLSAPGYGGKPYGNGKIFVYKKQGKM